MSIQDFPPSADSIQCPWSVLNPLIEVTNQQAQSIHAYNHASLFECNPRTLGIHYVGRTKRQGKDHYTSNNFRIERYMLNQDEELETLFDTIYSATLEGKGPAETMLEMLGTSLDNS